MGNIIRFVKQTVWKITSKVIFVGEEASGKTTALGNISYNQIAYSTPIFGLVIQTFDLGTANLALWDINGYWSRFYENVDGIVFFTDLARYDNEYIKKSKALFLKLMQNPLCQHAPLLFIGNKMDLANITLSEMQGYHQLHLQVNRKIKSIEACSKTEKGKRNLREGLQWLNNQILAKK